MKRICILSHASLKHTVMISIYTDFLKEHKEDYCFDYIYMDKYKEKESTGANNTYRYTYDGRSLKGKILGYVVFSQFAKKILKANKYDFIIVWGELTAVLSYKTLISYYSGKYCINIRDLFVNKRKVLNYLLYKVIRKARYVSVSSKDYIKMLPADYNNYVFFHSYNDSFMRDTIRKSFDIDKPKIQILFIGNIRFYDYIFKFINLIKNDERFEFVVAGTASNPVENYISRKSINNVKVIDEFPREETPNFLSKADVIYNIYGTDDVNLRMALSNKLYYALSLHIPILVCKDTAMFDFSSSCGIGYAIDVNSAKNFANEFYDWYLQLDREDIAKRCDKMIEAVKTSQNILLNTFIESVK